MLMPMINEVDNTHSLGVILSELIYCLFISFISGEDSLVDTFEIVRKNPLNLKAFLPEMIFNSQYLLIMIFMH